MTLLLPLTAAVSDRTNDILPQDALINLFHWEKFLTLISFSSFCKKIFLSIFREVLIVTSAIHLIKKLPLVHA